MDVAEAVETAIEEEERKMTIGATMMGRDLAGAATKKAAVGRRLWQREVGEEERWPAADEGGEEGSNGKGTVLPRAGRWEMRRRRQPRLMWERIRR
ncbi:hypothetical protein GW17_00043735 [Ensete ventricosum]|nr:hypothetical protein GW17_00043735 [Ensete ventricosum]